MKKHIFAALAFHGLDRPLLAFADLYWLYLALIEFFGQLEVFLVKKYIEMNLFHIHIQILKTISKPNFEL